MFIRFKTVKGAKKKFILIKFDILKNIKKICIATPKLTLKRWNPNLLRNQFQRGCKNVGGIKTTRWDSNRTKLKTKETRRYMRYKIQKWVFVVVSCLTTIGW